MICRKIRKERILGWGKKRKGGLPARLVMALDRARAEVTPLPVPDMSSPSSSLENFSLTISASATHKRESFLQQDCNLQQHNERWLMVQEQPSPEGGPSCRTGLGGTASEDELPVAALSEGLPASGGGRSTDSRLPLDPQLLDSARRVQGCPGAGASASIEEASVPSEASESGDDADADLRRLNENLSRPWPIFWNGRAITSAWLARARPLRHPQCQRGAFSFLADREESGEGGGGRWLARFRGRCVWEVRRGRGGGREGRKEGSTSWGRACVRSAGRLRLLFVFVVGGRRSRIGWFLGLPCPMPSLENGSVPGMQRQAFYRARPPDSVRPAGWPPNIKSRHALIAQHGATACEIFRCSCDNDRNRAVHGGVGLSSCLRLAQLLDRWMSTNSLRRFVLRILLPFEER